MSVQNTAAALLQRAADLDNKQRYTESLVCYQEGMQILVNLMKETTEDKRAYLRTKIEGYMKRAEEIKEIITKLKHKGKYHEQLRIDNDSTGHSYQSVFGRFLDADVVEVKLEDPYIRNFYQCQNFLRFCELLIKKCTHLVKIILITSRSPERSEQEKWLNELKADLNNYKVRLEISFSDTLHDRQMVLSTGWIIKIGRGLDYFKPPKSKHCLGVYDLDLRACHETVVDIFHSNNVKTT